MVKDIREHMGFTQEDMAGFFVLSIDMIRSIELYRRQLPEESAAPAVMFLKTILDCKQAGPVNDDPTLPSDRQLRDIQWRLTHGRHKLFQYNQKLKEMRRLHAAACFNLKVCQCLMPMLPAQTLEDNARLKWMEYKIAEIRQCIQDNNSAAQILIVARIASLQSMVETLETFQ